MSLRLLRQLLFLCLFFPMQLTAEPLPSTYRANHANTPYTDCWNTLLFQNFSAANTSLSNLPDIFHNGFSRSGNGASGASGDYCAMASTLLSTYYIGVKASLVGGKTYRLRWVGKSAGAAKSVDLHIGITPQTSQPVSGPYHMPIQNINAPGIAFSGETFSVGENGQYFILLKRSNNSSTSGSIRFDDIRLEQVCETTTVSFATGTPYIIYGAEGSSFSVCLNIENPSASQATTAYLNFQAGNTPHFSGVSAPIAVHFPAGYNGAKCVNLPSTVFDQIDTRSQYPIVISQVIGGNSAQTGNDAMRVFQVQDNTNCWITSAQEDFSVANSSLSNVPGLAQNNNATRANYGATGYSWDYCAVMQLSTSKYFGFIQYLTPGKQYRVRWNLKADDKNDKTVYLTTGLQPESSAVVGHPLRVPLKNQAEAGVDYTFEYFTVNTPGNYYILLRSNDGLSAAIKFDNFSLEERCPSTQVFLPQSTVSSQEGNSVQICVNIQSPSSQIATSVELAFADNRHPHFAGSPAVHTLTFPPGSTAQQCVTLHSSANGLYDGGSTTYTLRLQNVSGPTGAFIGPPGEVYVQLDDDVSLADCDWAGPDRQVCSGDTLLLGVPPAQLPAHCMADPFCFRWEPAHLILPGDEYEPRARAIPMQDTWFVVHMTDGHGNIYSDSVFVTVVPGPVITTHPTGATVCSNGTHTLHVGATGGNPSLTYQWQRSTDNGTTWTNVAGATTPSWTTPNLSTTTQYRAVVSGSGCGVTMSNPAAVTVIPAPHFVDHPAGATICAGGTHTMSASAGGGFPELNYQWQYSFDGNYWIDIQGAETPQYTTPSLQWNMLYRVRAGAAGAGCLTAFSLPAPVIVTAQPGILTHPAGAAVCPGATHTLSVTASGGVQELSYQWLNSIDGAVWTAVNGATSSTFTTPPIHAPMHYMAVISSAGNGCISASSQPALVTAAGPPASGISPAAPVLCPGAALVLSVPGAEGMQYTWSTGSQSPQLPVTQPGMYSLTLTDPTYGCTTVLQTNVTQAPAWTQSIGTTSNFFCEDVWEIKLTAQGTAGGSYAFAWSNGANNHQITVFQPGAYHLTLTDNATGCSTVLSQVLQNSDTDIALHIEAPTAMVCRNGELGLQAVLTGLHESLLDSVQFFWRHDESEGSIGQVYEPGDYEVTANFGSGCRTNAAIVIEGAPTVEVRIQPIGEIRYACPESPLVLSVSDTTLVAAYAWSTGETGSSIVVSERQTWFLTMTDAYGCIHEDYFEPDNCPTIVYFEDTTLQVKAGEEVEVCVRLANPSNDTPTEALVRFDGSTEPYFDADDVSRRLYFAPGENRVCLSYAPPHVDNADSLTVYLLHLAEVTGGNNAAPGLAHRAELTVEAGIRCRVQQDSADVNCALTDTTTIHNGVPLITTLKKEDSFWAGDFEVKVTQANGNGTFNGRGIITVPYLNQVQINVVLKDVRVNEQCQMVAGEVKVEGVGAALLSEELANALNDLLGALDDIDEVLGRVEDVFNTISTVINASSAVNSVLSTPWNVLHGADPIFREYPDLPDSLRQQINEALLCYLSQPPSVCNEQLAQTINNLIAAINALFEADYAIQFRRYPQQHFGFDSLMYLPMVDDYNFLTVAGQPYYVAWKSVEAGHTDSVLLVTPYANLPADLHFETNSRTPVPHHEHACGAGCADNGAAILPVMGGEHNEVYQIYPVQTRTDAHGETERKYAGKLNVISYNRKNVEVVLVPVNGAGSNLTDNDRAAIQSQLNDIYRPAIVSFTVELLPNLTISSFSPPLSSSATIEMVSDYNSSMNKIRKALFQSGNYHSNKYFILLISEFDESNIRGYMPLGRNIGFVATSPHAGNIGALSRTIAHELGHGAFTLKHTWEEYSGLEANATSNLMDKGTGTDLQKFQWDLIHNPRPTRPIFHAFEQSMSDVDEYELWFDEFVSEMDDLPGCPTGITGGIDLVGDQSFVKSTLGVLLNLAYDSEAGYYLFERAAKKNIAPKLAIIQTNPLLDLQYKPHDVSTTSGTYTPYGVISLNFNRAKEPLPIGQGLSGIELPQFVFSSLGHEMAHHKGFPPHTPLVILLYPTGHQHAGYYVNDPIIMAYEVDAVKYENRIRSDFQCFSGPKGHPLGPLPQSHRFAGNWSNQRLFYMTKFNGVDAPLRVYEKKVKASVQNPLFYDLVDDPNYISGYPPIERRRPHRCPDLPVGYSMCKNNHVYEYKLYPPTGGDPISIAHPAAATYLAVPYQEMKSFLIYKND